MARFDVFVSYSQKDNHPIIPGNDASRWVSAFLKALESASNRLATRSIKFFFDEDDLPRHEQVQERLRGDLIDSRILMPIVSPAYFNSTWCEWERKAFGDAMKENSIFPVKLRQFEPDELPNGLRGLVGYEFFGENGTLGTPTIDDDKNKDAYFMALNRLAEDVCKSLEILSKPIPGGATSESSQSESQAAHPAIYLAETPIHLRKYRDGIAAQLKRESFRVLPERKYARDPLQFTELARTDMQESLLFVQLVSDIAEDESDDLKHGYEGLQKDCANELQLPIRRWLHPECPQDDDRAVGAELATIEEFTESIVKYARKIISKSHVESTVKNWGDVDGLVMVRHNSQDQDIASQAIVECAQDAYGCQLGVEVIDESRSKEFPSTFEADNFLAVMVVWGDSSANEVSDWLRQIRKLIIMHPDIKEREVEVAVYNSPPDKDLQLSFRPPMLHTVATPARDQSLHEFLKRVAVKAHAVEASELEAN